MNRTLEQRRAAYALEFVTRNTGEQANQLDTHIQNTPIRILQNGLGQALAFLLANNERKSGAERKASGLLYDHLEVWLCGPRNDDMPCRIYDGQQCNLMKQLITGERSQYLLAQDESLALFAWLKMFAKAYLSDDGAEGASHAEPTCAQPPSLRRGRVLRSW
ncbi:MAG: type III-B CRISPR module-associated protein Cmr5 [Gammaproteobacteria bacterium]